MIVGSVSALRQRGCVNIHGQTNKNGFILERLIGISSHHLDMERLIGRSVYLILEGQICLLLGLVSTGIHEQNVYWKGLTRD